MHAKRPCTWSEALSIPLSALQTPHHRLSTLQNGGGVPRRSPRIGTRVNWD